MLEIKNPPIASGGSLNNNKYSITLINTSFQAPEIIKEIVELYKKEFINLSNKIILNILLVKLFQWLNFYRVKFDLTGNGKYIIPNWYVLVLAPSRYGKDYLLKTYNDFLFKPFEDKFRKHVERYKQNKIEKIKQQSFNEYKDEKARKAFEKEAVKNIRHIEPETQNATSEGFYADCRALNDVAFGGVFICINEFAGYLSPLTPEKELFLNVLFIAYDGVIESKSIKSSNRDITIKDMPVNVLLYSDHSKLLKKSSKENTILNDLLDRGLAGRLTITFIPTATKKKHTENTQADSYRNNIKSVEYGNKLDQIFDKLNFDGVAYKVTPETYNNVYRKYVNEMIDKENDTKDEKLKKEIGSRAFKAIKLACLYAALNHVDIKEIQENDLIQAISTVEYLSSDFEKMINYKPFQKDRYDELLDFFIKNEKTKFKKGDLMNIHKQFNFKREEFRSKLDSEIVDILKEMALERGYMFCTKPINNNTGNLYYLIKNQNTDSTPVNPEYAVNLNNDNAFESYTDCNSENSENKTSKTSKTCKSETSTIATDLQDLLDVQEVK